MGTQRTPCVKPVRPGPRAMDRMRRSNVRRAHTPARDQKRAPSATRINFQVRGTPSAQSVPREVTPAATVTATRRASGVQLVIPALAMGRPHLAARTTSGRRPARALALCARPTDTRREWAARRGGKVVIRVPRGNFAMAPAIRTHAWLESTAVPRRVEHAPHAGRRICTALPGPLVAAGASRGATPTVYLDIRAQRRRDRSAKYARRVPHATQTARRHAWQGRPHRREPDHAPNVVRIANIVRLG